MSPTPKDWTPEEEARLNAVLAEYPPTVGDRLLAASRALCHEYYHMMLALQAELDEVRAGGEAVAVIGPSYRLLWCRQDWSKGLKVGDKLYAAAGGVGDLLEHAKSMQAARTVVSEMFQAAEAFMEIYNQGDAPDSAQEGKLIDAITAASNWLICDVRACLKRDRLLNPRPTANGAGGQS